MTQHPARGATSGFSLLELVAVLAIFAVVALIGVQALNTVLGAERRLRVIEQDVGRLSLTLKLMRRDLRHIVDLPVVGTDDTPRAAVLLRPADGVLELTVSGVMQAAMPPTDGLGRVIWRFDGSSGLLARQVGPLSNTGAGNARPRPMLDDIIGIRFFLFDPVGGWRQIDTDLAVPLSTGALAVEIEHRRHGAFRVMVAQ